MGLSYGQVRSVLTRSARIHPDKREAFASRMKQWQKQPLNFPKGTNVGKGMRADYGADQFFQLAFMIELLRIGMTPDRAVIATETMWPEIQTALYDTLVCSAGRGGHAHYLAIQVESLAGLQEANHPGKLGIYLNIQCFTSDQLHPDAETKRPSWAKQNERISRARGLLKRVLRGSLVMELDSFLILLLDDMKHEGIDLHAFSDDLKRWSVGAAKATTRLHGAVANAQERDKNEQEDHEKWRRNLPTRADGAQLSQEMLGLPDRFAARRLEPNFDKETDVDRLRWQSFQKPSEEEQQAFDKRWQRSRARTPPAEPSDK